MGDTGSGLPSMSHSDRHRRSSILNVKHTTRTDRMLPILGMQSDNRDVLVAGGLFRDAQFAHYACHPTST